MTRRNFLKLLTLFISWLWFVKFTSAILPIHFIQEGLTPAQIVLNPLFAFFAISIMTILRTNYSAKKSWYFSIAFYALYVLAIIKIFSPLEFYGAALLYGLTGVFFFVPYNIAHFENSPKHRTGISSAIMFNVWPIIGIGAPFLAGAIAQVNFIYVWIASAIFGLLPLFLIKRQDDFKIKYSITKALKEIKATRIYIFLFGFWDSLNQAIIPIYALFFIKSPLYYGIYLAYLSLISILANLIIGHITDKIQKRSVFLYPVAFLTGFATLIFIFATENITYWIIVTGVIQLFVPILTNLSTSLVVDSHKDLRLAMPGRELLLSVGRVLGLFLVFLSFVFEKTPFIIFFVLSGSMILFGLLLMYNNKISKKYKYL
jgi:MFS family permease